MAPNFKAKIFLQNFFYKTFEGVETKYHNIKRRILTLTPTFFTEKNYKSSGL